MGRSGVVAALTMGLVVALAGCTGSGSAAPTPTGGRTSSPSPTVSAAGPEVSYHGIGIPLLPGWKTSTFPLCTEPPNHTVSIDDGFVFDAACPAIQQNGPPPTFMTVGSLFAPGNAREWRGTRTTWHGQPAWTQTSHEAGRVSMTLSLPWLNVFVTAKGDDASQARALLAGVELQTTPRWTVPQQAQTVDIQLLTRGQHRFFVTGHAVSLLLRELIGLRPIAPADACSDLRFTSEIVLEVNGISGFRTYLIRPGACGQVTGGTGTGAQLSANLKRELDRLITAHSS
jgi:hypothetical protein